MSWKRSAQFFFQIKQVKYYTRVEALPVVLTYGHSENVPPALLADSNGNLGLLKGAMSQGTGLEVPRCGPQYKIAYF